MGAKHATTPRKGSKDEIKRKESFSDILGRACKRALGGGLPGAFAMVINVFTMMWLRTTINYQHRFGCTMQEAMSRLWADGGVARFYEGLPAALVQAEDSQRATSSDTTSDNDPRPAGPTVPVRRHCR